MELGGMAQRYHTPCVSYAEHGRFAFCLWQTLNTPIIKRLKTRKVQPTEHQLECYLLDSIEHLCLHRQMKLTEKRHKITLNYKASFPDISFVNVRVPVIKQVCVQPYRMELINCIDMKFVQFCPTTSSLHKTCSQLKKMMTSISGDKCNQYHQHLSNLGYYYY